MKIKINGEGNLEIERAEEFKKQYCPFAGETSAGGPISCGDWCPCFSEICGEIAEGQHINICNKFLYSKCGEEIVDERKLEDECPF